jgi:hypothetical protein
MKDLIYQQAIAEVKRLIDELPEYNTRAKRFEIIKLLTGRDEETARIIDRYARAIREVIPADEKGIELEKDWHLKDYQKTFINEHGQSQLFKSIIKSL